MMKKFFLITIIGLFSQLSYSQSPLGDGGIQLNAGFNLNDVEGLPLYAGADFGVSPDVTVGGKVGFGSDFFSIGGNVNYHFDRLFELPPEWNVYGGANLALIDYGDDTFDLGVQLGSRYFFSDDLGLNLQVGAGTSLAGGNLGITYIIR